MKPVPAEARALHDDAVVVDLHCDILLTSLFLGWNWGRRHRPNPLRGAPLMGHCDIPRMREGGLDAAALGLVTNPLRLRRGTGPKAVDAHLDRLHGRLARHPEDLALATSAPAIRAAKEAGRIAVFAGLEGAHPLDGQRPEDHLPRWRERGLVYVGLVHFSANAAARPMVGWGRRDDAGLTDFGRHLLDVIRAERLVVDVAHLNPAGVREVCARAGAPVLCSHTGIDAVHPSGRGLDDDGIRAIADTDGVIGIIFVEPFIGPGGVEAVAEHLDHVRRLVGARHCAIGSDWEGFALYPRDLDGADKLPALTAELLRRGWSDDEVRGVLGENFLRLLAAVQA